MVFCGVCRYGRAALRRDSELRHKSTGHYHDHGTARALAALRQAIVLTLALALILPSSTSSAAPQPDTTSQKGEQGDKAEAPSIPEKIIKTLKNPRILLPSDPFITVSHKWDKAVRGFRKGHNFSLLGSYRRVAFSLSKDTYPEVSRQLVAGQLRYAYHIQSDRNVGYFLGSSIGYLAPQVRGPEELEYQRFVEFPSLLVGGVFNASSYFRVYTYFEGYLTRLERFRRLPFTNAIDTTGETVRAGAGFDLFYLLEWGVTFDASYYWSSMRAPKPESTADHGVESVIMSGNSFALGLVLHLI